MDFINSHGKTLVEVAAFVGQHMIVRIIRNFIPLSDVKYFTIPQGIYTHTHPHVRVRLHLTMSPGHTSIWSGGLVWIDCTPSKCNHHIITLHHNMTLAPRASQTSWPSREKNNFSPVKIASLMLNFSTIWLVGCSWRCAGIEIKSIPVSPRCSWRYAGASIILWTRLKTTELYTRASRYPLTKIAGW